MNTLLAFDTATERMSIAVAVGEQQWSHEADGGTLASANLIPAIRGLLARAGIRLAQVDAIAFGRGPGAFTGLRTACAVAQGLAFGAGKPVLPVDTLWAVAEDARAGRAPLRVWSAMDARMGEIYAAEYAFAAGRWRTLRPAMLVSPQALNESWAGAPPEVVAGNALSVFGDRLQLGDAEAVPHAMPSAVAMLPLARQLALEGGAVDAQIALPIYLRDKVARTSAERAAGHAPQADLDRAT
jgi:tRNA threonylcarbamoyladenosine biosynthesis protein TsaB